MTNGKDLLDFRLHGIMQPMLIVWGSQDDLIPLSVGEVIHKSVPQSVLVRAEEGASEPAPARDRPALRGVPTAYVCVRGACQLPVTEPDELRKLLA